jgi:hypothetical protein
MDPMGAKKTWTKSLGTPGLIVLVYRGKKSRFLQGLDVFLTLLSTRKIHADPCKPTFLSPVDEYSYEYVANQDS